jgi:hypothetical protein
MRNSRNDNFIFLAPLSAISNRVRLFKISNFIYYNFNTNIIHLGWERVKGEEKENLEFEVHKKIILKGGGYGNSTIRYLYFLWMIKAFFNCLLLKKKDIIWALGFESAFPALIAGKIIGFKVIFDDADRFSKLINFPKPIKIVIEKLERYTSRNVSKHIIPGIDRYNFDSPKFYILKNMPSSVEVEKGKKLFEKNNFIKANIVINVNGWLGRGRGMDAVLALCTALQDEDVAFILSGKLDCEDAFELVKFPNIQYLGIVSNAVALSSYYASDFVFTYYDPAFEINTLAESNKWGDAIKTGIGIIVNREVKTAKYLRDAEACISFAYSDHQSLIKEIKRLLLVKKDVATYKENVLALSSKFDFFEMQLKSLLSNYENSKQNRKNYLF